MNTQWPSLNGVSREMVFFRRVSYNAMRHKILLSVLVLIICESSLFAQNKYDFSQFGRETGDFVKQPTKWDGSDWLRLGVMGGAAFLTMQVDQSIRDAVLKDNKRYYYSIPIEAGRMYGELYSPVVFFAGFAAHSLITNNMSSRKIAYEIGQASLYTGAITLLLKTAIGRARPYMDEGTSSYRPFSSLLDRYHSFPGGHTATAFVISTVLSRNVHPTWLKILVYLPAVITPISRVYQDQHWMSDNVFGGALGYFVAKWVADIHERNDKQDPGTSSTPLINLSFVLN
jgi:membrane-associated phospholipid phosphatase